MKYILHIDTSSDTSLVALAGDGELLATEINTNARNHASVINLQINAVLEKTGISLKELNAIAVCGGPGSYTGLRIGLATAKALCYVNDTPLMMHSRLLLLALDNYYHKADFDQFGAVLPARQGEYFLSVYDKYLKEIIEPKHFFTADLHMFFDATNVKTLISGHIEEIDNSIIDNKNIHYIENQLIKIEHWVRFSLNQYDCQSFVNLANAEPFYLKQVHTHNSKKIN